MKECAFVDVQVQNSSFIDKLAELSYHSFRGHAPNWLPTIDAAREEVTESLEAGRHSRALVDTAQEPVGWVGVIPHSGGRVWEIHPIAVRTADQGKGCGRLLVEHVERLAQSHGVLTLFAGTSDGIARSINCATEKRQIACVAGALWAYHTGFVSVEAFDFHMLIQFLAMVIIGGLGSVLGACLGAVFVVVLPHIISIAADKLPFLQGLGGKSFDLQVGVFGVVMLLFLIFEPRGLAGIWARVRFYFQLWPFKYRAWES